MEPHQIIETTGSITKLERLINVEDNTLNNTLVLSNKNPFPGFVESTNDSKKPIKLRSYYIILMYRYFTEKLERIAKILAHENLITCSSSFGEIIIDSKIYPCVRIKNLKAPEVLREIQKFYKKNDIKFMANKPINNSGVIKVFKHFRIIEISEGIYRDLNDSEKIYIRIPMPINLKFLHYITDRVNSTLSNTNFDCALGVINRFSGPEDIVRIYDKNKSLERALELKKRFIKELKSKRLFLSNISNYESNYLKN